MTIPENITKQVATANIQLEHDLFMHTLIRELTNSLVDVVGTDHASGFISKVGQVMGNRINEQYCKALETTSMTKEQVAAALVDLKKRINGDFSVVEINDKKIVLISRKCPFADQVVGQTLMCMTTSNVFGSIAAANLGYARVHLKETIAEGSPECHVEVYLKMGGETDGEEGREYFRTP
jgi:predicted ArsR family transcriptional regulator